MNELNETGATTNETGATTNETGATTNETAQTAPVESAPKAPKNKKSAPKAPPVESAPKTKTAPQLKLSARQRSNVDAFDNSMSSSASAINHVLAHATRPLTSAEITTGALALAPDKFTRETAHGRVKNHLAHLLRRALIVNTNGAWRIVGAVSAATKILKTTAPKSIDRAMKKIGAPATTGAEESAPE